MTDVKYDAELCERLEREAKADDERLPAGPFSSSSKPSNTGAVVVYDDEGTPVALTNMVWGRQPSLDLDAAAAIARTRNNLRAITDQLAAARAEIARLTADAWHARCDLADEQDRDSAMQPVVDAVMHWSDSGQNCETLAVAVAASVDAYRAARDKAGQS